MSILSLLKASLLFISILVLLPTFASAHQPRIVESRQTIVSNPEVSKAYYGKLEGVPDVYVVEDTNPFDLYVGVLVPDIEGQKKDVSAVVLKDGIEIAQLEGMNFEWR